MSPARQLYDAVRAYVTASPDLLAFAEGPLPDAPPERATSAHLLPCVPDVLATCRSAPSGTSAALMSMLAETAERLVWRQTYTRDQVGEAYLNQYGFVDIAGPDGPIILERLRITLGYWGPGLIYPAHSHVPEECYAVLAGQALFQTDGKADATLGPGALRHHPSGVRHGMVVGGAPLLVLALWKGADLMAPSRLLTEEAS